MSMIQLEYMHCALETPSTGCSGGDGRAVVATEIGYLSIRNHFR